jgi:hypothetical protein
MGSGHKRRYQGLQQVIRQNTNCNGCVVVKIVNAYKFAPILTLNVMLIALL